MPGVDCHLVMRSLEGPPDACGDTGVVARDEHRVFVGLVDVLGHGREANVVALLAEQYLQAHWTEDMIPLLQGLHDHLKGSRGAVASLCRLDAGTGELRFVGTGNITCRLFGADHQRLLPRDGIIGYMMSAPREQILTLVRGDVLMLYSDGIKEHFETFDCPGLLQGSAADIAARVMAHFAKGDDDASCLVMRYEG